MQPIEHAWALLKADRAMNIREVGPDTEDNPYHSEIPQEEMTTMHPIIARLIEERNKERAQSDNPRVDFPHYLQEEYENRLDYDLGEGGWETSGADMAREDASGKFSGDFKVRPPHFGVAPGFPRNSNIDYEEDDIAPQTFPARSSEQDVNNPYPFAPLTSRHPTNLSYSGDLAVYPGSDMDRLHM